MIAAPCCSYRVVFTFVIVLPAAVKFLQGLQQPAVSTTWSQAKPLYSFEVLNDGRHRAAFHCRWR